MKFKSSHPNVTSFIYLCSYLIFVGVLHSDSVTFLRKYYVWFVGCVHNDFVSFINVKIFFIVWFSLLSKAHSLKLYIIRKICSCPCLIYHSNINDPGQPCSERSEREFRSLKKRRRRVLHESFFCWNCCVTWLDVSLRLWPMNMQFI